jgi:hypothetical protein
LIREYVKLQKKPKITVLLGFDGDTSHVSNGDSSAKADQVYGTLIDFGNYRDLWFEHDGKPLLVIYVWTPPSTPTAYWTGRTSALPFAG